MLWTESELSEHIMKNKKPLAKVARERALTYGIKEASLDVLLATILGGNIPDETLNALLTEGIVSISTKTVEELITLPGISKNKAAALAAAFELARKLASTTPVNRPTIRSPEDAADLVMKEMRFLDREHFKALLLNTKNQLIARETISIGTLNASTIHPRELFKSAIRRSSAAVILVHNHPSGDPTPSKEDIDVTRRLQETGGIIGIEVLDHIIIGDNRFLSLKEKGLL